MKNSFIQLIKHNNKFKGKLNAKLDTETTHLVTFPQIFSQNSLPISNKMLQI